MKIQNRTTKEGGRPIFFRAIGMSAQPLFLYNYSKNEI